MVPETGELLKQEFKIRSQPSKTYKIQNNRIIGQADGLEACLLYTSILKDCNVNGGILAKFDADAEYLDEELEFTFEDFEMPEEFSNLSGML